MNLEKHYNDLWQNALQGFRSGAFEIDPFLNSAADDRYGLTLLFRPEPIVTDKISTFLQELRQLEPEQYYYPASDMHVTVMSVISCHPGFRLGSIQLEEYLAVLQECLADIKPFKIDFAGITASPSCIMIQGFPATATLHNLRNKLRERFRTTTLRQTMDSRYVLQTAHCTVVRFKEPLRNAPAFLDKLQEYGTHDFGSTEVEQVELVYNDWYQRQALVQQLALLKLK
jgi:2'-5' RNA ligase